MVKEWLTHVRSDDLQQNMVQRGIADLFMQHEINGKVLVQLSMDKLQYMQVPASCIPILLRHVNKLQRQRSRWFVYFAFSILQRFVWMKM